MAEVGTPPGHVRIETARPEHDAEVGRLLTDAYTAAGYFAQWGEDPTGPDGYAHVLRDVEQRRRDAHVLVALEDDAVLGSITVARHGSPVAEIARPGEAEVRMLGVDPSARGRGVAGRLLDAAVDDARASGAEAVVLLSIEPPEHVESRYRRRGFERDPLRDEHWDEEAIAAGTATPYPVWVLDLTGAARGA